MSKVKNIGPSCFENFEFYSLPLMNILIQKTPGWVKYYLNQGSFETLL